jgi:hypothetical protein
VDQQHGPQTKRSSSDSAERSSKLGYQTFMKAQKKEAEQFRQHRLHTHECEQTQRGALPEEDLTATQMEQEELAQEKEEEEEEARNQWDHPLVGRFPQLSEGLDMEEYYGEDGDIDESDESEGGE